jgi:hypothetical protein
MATKAKVKLNGACVDTFTVAAGQTVTDGFRVKFAAVDGECQNCGAGEDGFGYALASATAGQKVSIVLEGTAVVKVKVGTGGATRGAYAIPVANGLADQAIADGTTPRRLAGKFMQSGVAGDFVGMLIGIATPMSTA